MDRGISQQHFKETQRKYVMYWGELKNVIRAKFWPYLAQNNTTNFHPYTSAIRINSKYSCLVYEINYEDC